MLIKIKLDVSKIDKERLFKGDKGTYLDATLFLNEEPDRYGNYGMITQDVSKEERQSGIKGAILGNVKVINAKPYTPLPAVTFGQNEPKDDDSSLPF